MPKILALFPPVAAHAELWNLAGGAKIQGRQLCCLRRSGNGGVGSPAVAEVLRLEQPVALFIFPKRDEVLDRNHMSIKEESQATSFLMFFATATISREFSMPRSFLLGPVSPPTYTSIHMHVCTEHTLTQPGMHTHNGTPIHDHLHTRTYV